MKATLLIVAGAVIVLAAHHWAKPTAWLLTHNPPTTPHGWAPKYRTAHNGKWTEGAWDA
jgi:hypothetical protein